MPGALQGSYGRAESAFLFSWCVFYISSLFHRGGDVNRFALLALLLTGLAVHFSLPDRSLGRIRKVVLWGLFLYVLTNFVAVLIPSGITANNFQVRNNGPFYSFVLTASVIWGCRNRKSLRYLLFSLVTIFGIFFAVKLLTLPWSTQQFAFGRYTGNMGHHPNILAAALVALIPMLAGAACIQERLSVRAALGTGSLIILILLFLTQCRYALLVFFLVVLPLGIFLFPTRLPKKSRAVIVLVVVLVIVPAGAGMWQHYASEERRSLESVYGRLETWHTALALSVDGPFYRTILGHGSFKNGYRSLARHYGRESQERPGEPVHAHNIYLQTLDESGVIGLLALFVPWFMLIRGLTVRPTTGDKGINLFFPVLLVAMVTISAAGFFDHTFSGLSGKLMFGVLGMSAALLAVSKNRMVTTVRGHQGSAL